MYYDVFTFLFSAAAVVLAEMGDKTQLATIALATKFPESPLWQLLGTTAGMLVADAIGIVVGVLMCRKIPEKTVKLVSAGVFIIFGFIGTYHVGIVRLGLSLLQVNAALLILAAATFSAAHYLFVRSAEKDARTFVQCLCKEIKATEVD